MKRVLVVRAGALGDLLLIRPVVAALKGVGARVTIMAPAGPGRALLGPGPSEADELIPWDRPDLAGLMADATRLDPALRGGFEAFDLAIAYTRNQALVRNLSRLVTSVVSWDPTPPAGGFHAARCFAEPVARLGLEVDPLPPDCVPTEAEAAAAAATLRDLETGFVAIHPGSGSPAKNWPAPCFASLAERLAEGRPWLLVEGPADARPVADMGAPAGGIVARELPPRVLGALFACCALFVGNDSGITHLAAAFGAPVVALFGPTDPALWGPVGRKVRALRSPDGRMAGLDLADVEAACRAEREPVR